MLEDLLQKLRGTGFVEAHLLIAHADPKDTRQFHVFLETPNQRSEIDIGKDGSFRLPELAKEDAKHASVKHSLERGALDLSFGFSLGGTLPFEHPEGKTLFELCAPAVEKLGQFNHVWRDIAEAFHEPEINSVQFAIVGLNFPRQKPGSGRLVLMRGHTIVDAIDLSHPGTHSWLFEEYDPKTHSIVWTSEHHGEFPLMRAMFKVGRGLDSYRGAIFIRKGDDNRVAKGSQPVLSETNQTSSTSVEDRSGRDNVGAGSIRLITKETLLGPVPFTAELKQMVLSPDNLHVAFPVMRSGQWTVWRDGVEGGQFKAIMNLRFSPDGQRLAYVGARGGHWQEQDEPHPITEPNLVTAKLRDAKWLVVVDGQEGQEYDGIGMVHPVFSSDSRHVAYVADLGTKWRMVVDGEEGAQFDFILPNDSVFSPDGSRVAYSALQRGNGKEFAVVVVDGKKGPEVDRIGDPIFSPDSKRFAYNAAKAGKCLVVVDGKEGKKYDIVYSNPCFSPDSQDLAYVAEHEGKRVVVVDGKEESVLNPAGRVVFSPDSKHMAYVAERSSGQFAVVDGKKGKEYRGVVGLVFSPDSQKLACAAYLKPGSIGGTVVVNGEEGPVFDGIGADSITFSPDNQRLAYAAFRRGKWVVVVDGKEGPEFKDISNGSPLFSPDSQRLAYSVTRDGKRLVVVDGQEGIEYDAIGRRYPEFSSDSRHVVYFAKRGPKGLFVIDGKESPEYNVAWRQAFDGPNRIRFVATRFDESFNENLLQVEIEIVEK